MLRRREGERLTLLVPTMNFGEGKTVSFREGRPGWRGLAVNRYKNEITSVGLVPKLSKNICYTVSRSIEFMQVERRTAAIG